MANILEGTEAKDESAEKVNMFAGQLKERFQINRIKTMGKSAIADLMKNAR